MENNSVPIMAFSVAMKYLQILQLSVVYEIHVCDVLQAFLVFNVADE